MMKIETVRQVKIKGDLSTLLDVQKALNELDLNRVYFDSEISVDPSYMIIKDKR